MAGITWTYAHRNLKEPQLPDGSPVLRPCVTVAPVGGDDRVVAVVDSGAPLSIANPALFAKMGIDVAAATPIMEVPLGIGASSGRVPVFEVELNLMPPPGAQQAPQRWTLQLGVRAGWRLPFTILLGQRGWFDRFATTIDAKQTIVHVHEPDAAKALAAG
jgi:hypothetical protein